MPTPIIAVALRLRDVLFRAIVRFGDILGAAYTGPPLTTIHVDVEGIMTTATTLLLDLIAGKEALSRSLSVPTLIVRGSTGPCPHPL